MTPLQILKGPYDAAAANDREARGILRACSSDVRTVIVEQSPRGERRERRAAYKEATDP